MLDKIYKQEPDCVFEEMDSEALIYNPSAASTLHLNESSAVIWKLLDGERTVDDIIDMLKEAFPEQADQIENDVKDVITNMVDNKVVSMV